MTLKNKCLLVISHKKHIRDPLDYSNISVDGGFGAIKNEFAEHFAQVKLCVPVKEEEVKASHVYKNNIEVIPLPFYRNRKEMVMKSRQILNILKAEISNADIVYNMAPNDMGLIGLALSKLYRKKFFMSLDTDRARGTLTRNTGFLKKYSSYYFNKIFINNFIKLLGRKKPAFVTGNMFLGEHKNWHQWVKSTYKNKEINEYNNDLNLYNKEKINISFAGRLSSEKNVATLIKACKLLQNKNYNVHLNIIGNGNLKEELINYSNSLNLTNVRFMGNIPNYQLLETRFLNSDIFVLPSLEERQGKVLLEAMSCSIPIVASNTGGIPSVISHKKNGLLFNPWKVEELVSNIQELINNPTLNVDLVNNGYEFARKHSLDYEIEKIINELEVFYFADCKIKLDSEKDHS